MLFRSTPTVNLQVRVSGQVRSTQEIEDIPLRVNGNNFRLGDFAKVTRSYIDPPRDKMLFNGKEVVGLGVSMEKGGDIIELGRSLDAKAQQIQAKLPVGITLERVADQPRAVSQSVNEFLKVLAEAVLIVLAVSFISLGLHTKPWRIDIYPGWWWP